MYFKNSWFFMIKNIKNLVFIIFILILVSTLGFASANSDSIAADSSMDSFSDIAMGNYDGNIAAVDSNGDLNNGEYAADFKDNDNSTLLGNSDGDDSLKYEADGNSKTNLKQDYSLNSINENNVLKSQNVLYISPDGDEIGSGSLDDPTTWENAINLVDNGGTIVFLDGEYLLSNQYLDKNLTLKGLNSNAVISDTTFVVDSGNVFNIENLIFTDNEDYVIYSNGTVNVKDSRFVDNSADVLIQSRNASISGSNFTDNGGASVNGANITIDSSNFINNGQTPVSSIDELLVKNSSFINNTGNKSGAIYSVFNAEVYDSNFINNSAMIGGAINVVNNLTVENSNFEGNNASAGGAVFSKSSDIKDSNFTNNSAISGVISSNVLNIDNSVFNNNTATSKGIIYTVNATIENSQFNDNKAQGNITVFALNELNAENNDLDYDEIEVGYDSLALWDFDDDQWILENGYVAYCIQKSLPAPYDSVYILDDLDFVLNQITGEDVGEYLKILICQNLENENHESIQEAIWIFTDGNYKNSYNELVRNALYAYNTGTRISTQDARVFLSDGALVSLNFKATSNADSQNLFAYNIEELGVPNLTVVKKSLNPITDYYNVTSFEIIVINTGDVVLDNITVNETYGNYLGFLSWESVTGEWSSNDNKTFSLLKLYVGESASFKIFFNATNYGNLTNTVYVKSDETDVINASNSTFVPSYMLDLRKEPSSIDNIVNDTIYYNITVRNSGSEVLHDINLTDILPDSNVLEYLGVSESSPGLLRSEIVESNVTFYFEGDLGAGETFYVVLKFKALKTETGIINKASVVSDRVNQSTTSIVNVYNPIDLTINKTAFVWYDCPDYGIPYYDISSMVNYMAVNFTVAVKNTGNKTLETVVVEDYGFDRQLVYSYFSCPEIQGYIYRNGRNESNGYRSGDFSYTLNNLAPGETAFVNFLFLVYANQTGNFVVMNNSAYAYCPQEELNKSTTDTFVLSNPAMYTINKTAQEWLDCPDYGIPYQGIDSVVNYMAYNFTVTVKNTGRTTLETLVVGDFGLDAMAIYACPEINGYIYRNGRNVSNGLRTGVYNYTLEDLAPGETAYVKFIFLIYTDRPQSSGLLNNSAYAYYPNQGINKTNSTLFSVYAYTINKTAKVLYDNFTFAGVGVYGTNWMAVNFTATVRNTGPNTIPTLLVSDYGFNRELLYLSSTCYSINGYVIRNGRVEMNGYRAGAFDYALEYIRPGETAYVDFTFFVYYNASTNESTIMENSVSAYEPENNINKSYTGEFSLYHNGSYTVNKTVKVLKNFTDYDVGDSESNLFAVNFTVTVKNTGENILETLIVGDYGFDRQYVYSNSYCPEINGYVIRNGNVEPNGFRTGSFEYALLDIRPGETAYVDFLFILQNDNPGSEIVMNNSAYARYFNQNVSTTGTYVISAADLDANKTALNKTVYTNETNQAEFNITVVNTGMETLNNIVVSESQFDGLAYVSFDSSRSTGDWSVEVVDEKPVFKLASLERGAAANLIVVFNVTRKGNLTNIALVAADNVNQETVNATVEVIDVNGTFQEDYSLSAIKTALNKTVDRNQTNQTEFNITVENTGTKVLTNVTIVESQFRGLKFVSFDESRSNGDWIVDLSGEAPVFKLESLDVGTTANILVIFNLTKTGNITNIATVYADNVDKMDINDTIKSILVKEKNTKPPISAAASNFSVEKIASNNTVILNELVYYDLIVYNDGDSILHNIVLTDIPDEGLVYVGSNEDNGWKKVEGDGLKFMLELLKPGQSSVLRIYFNATKLGTLSNNASVTSDENETNTTETIEVKHYNMTVVKEIVTPTVYLGNQVIFDIVVNNTGDLDLNDVVVKDIDYDANALKLLSYKSIKGNWTGADGIYTLEDSLAPGEIAIIRLAFDTLKAGSFNNTAVASSNKTDDVNSTNETVVYNPGLSIVKIANNDVVNVGDEVSFTLLVENTGDCNLTGFYVIDRDHKGLSYKGFVDDSGLWQFDGVDTWVYTGILQPGETAGFDVIFTAISEGLKTNTAIVGFEDVNMSNSTNETFVAIENPTDNDTSDENQTPEENQNADSNSKPVEGLSLATGNPILVLLISFVALFSSAIYTRKR